MRLSTVGALLASCATGAAFFSYSMLSASAQDGDYANGQVIEMEAFDGLSLSSGGSVTVEASDSYSVRIIEGADSLELKLERGSLAIKCVKPCPWGSKRAVAVTVPSLENIAVAGGGSITIESGFAEQAELNAAVTGGGSLRAFNLPAREVNAAVTGGGSLQVTAVEDLSAAVVGGGSITYDGDPDVSSTTMGGGSIRKR